MSRLPGWTCPGLDAIAEIVRRHVPEPDRADALLLLEEQRRANLLLRAAAAEREPKADELARLDERIAELTRRSR